MKFATSSLEILKKLARFFKKFERSLLESLRCSQKVRKKFGEYQPAFRPIHIF
jgi:hypothetical protein